MILHSVTYTYSLLRIAHTPDRVYIGYAAIETIDD